MHNNIRIKEIKILKYIMSLHNTMNGLLRVCSKALGSWHAKNNFHIYFFF